MNYKATFSGSILILLQITSTGALAQDSCGDILAGVYDFRSLSTGSDNLSSFENTLCKSSSLSNRVSAFLPEEIRGDFTWAKSRCSASSGFAVNQTRFEQLVKTVNSKVAEAWQACMSKRGLKSGLIYAADFKTFHVVLNYIPVSREAPFAELFDGDIGFNIMGNATCNIDSLQAQGKRKIETAITLSCKRENVSELITIAINADPPVEFGGNVLTVVPIDEDGPPPPRAKERVCMRHVALGSGGSREEPFSCASEAAPSDWLFMNDDTGWKNQRLRILSDGGRACFQHQRWSPGGGLADTEWVCSARGDASPYVEIGDDSGYRDQKLRVRWDGVG